MMGGRVQDNQQFCIRSLLFFLSTTDEKSNNSACRADAEEENRRIKI